MYTKSQQLAKRSKRPVYTDILCYTYQAVGEYCYTTLKYDTVYEMQPKNRSASQL